MSGVLCCNAVEKTDSLDEESQNIKGFSSQSLFNISTYSEAAALKQPSTRLLQGPEQQCRAHET